MRARKICAVIATAVSLSSVWMVEGVEPGVGKLERRDLKKVLPYLSENDIGTFCQVSKKCQLTYCMFADDQARVNAQVKINPRPCLTAADVQMVLRLYPNLETLFIALPDEYGEINKKEFFELVGDDVRVALNGDNPVAIDDDDSDIEVIENVVGKFDEYRGRFQNGEDFELNKCLCDMFSTGEEIDRDGMFFSDLFEKIVEFRDALFY